LATNPSFKQNRISPGQVGDLLSLQQFNRVSGQSVRPPDETLEALTHDHWPGNARELANTIERFVIMADRGVVGSGNCRLILWVMKR
jgi:DNA-binding NtrC family response regulator